MSTAHPVHVTIDGAVAELVLNRPDKLNAIDEAVLDGLGDALDRVEAARAVRAVVVRGEGRAFSAGADLEAARARVEDPDALRAHLQQWRRVFDRLATSRLPSIAAVHGVAVAGGLELMLACDLCVVADDAHLGDAHAIWGLFPGGGATQRLPRLVGVRRALWLLFSGEPITPQQALAAGLVNAVVPPGDVLGEARRMAAVLASRSPVSIANMKAAVLGGLDAGSLEAGLDLEQEILAAHMTSRDVRIGIAAFADRETPRFVGE